MTRHYQPQKDIQTFPPGTSNWVLKVIRSCKTASQCQSCERLINNYVACIGNPNSFATMEIKRHLNVQLNKHKQTCIHV